jgi:hypothetical protein
MQGLASKVGLAAAAAAIVMALFRRRGKKAALEAALAAYEVAENKEDDDAGAKWLSTLAGAAGDPLDSAEFAAAMDASDPLHQMRNLFAIPAHGAGLQAYFAGNSLGLQPKLAQLEVGGEMSKWAARGVNGHFEGALPWATCEEYLPPLFAPMVGAKDSALEVGAMNSLTVNLHMLMAAFYRPIEGRAAIIIEAGAFPSDRYAVSSQIQHHGRNPEEWLIEVWGQALHSTPDIAESAPAQWSSSSCNRCNLARPTRCFTPRTSSPPSTRTKADLLSCCSEASTT